MVCNLWYHPYAKKVRTIKDKKGYTLRVEIHRAIYECHINNISLDEYKRILRSGDRKIKKLKFIDPSIFDIHHKDNNHKNNDPLNLIKLKKKDHQLLHSEKNKHNFNQGIPIFSKVKSVEYFGKDHTYDISCFENHNFVANGIVVHNSGKSLIQAMIVEWMLSFVDTRILLLTHQQELIKQNYIEVVDNLSDQLLDIGIYSAGLKLRHTKNRIMLAGIQSVHKRAYELGWFDIILVDEAHRIPGEKFGTYRFFLDEMIKINPKIVIGGLSATPYRMKSGLLCEGKDKIFDDICHNTSIPELINPNHFKNADRTQYLCEIISKNAVNKADMSRVHIRAGDYAQNEMEKAFLEGDLVCRAVNEINSYTQDRKKILVFTTGINHCEEVCEKINLITNREARFIHSKQNKEINKDNIKDFREGKYPFLVNIDILTTGFNQKDIDCIGMLRATKSPGLYYQIAGRGLRMAEGKLNCLFLDFGGNILLHGPIDRIEIRKRKDGKNELKLAPQKTCPQCNSVVHAAVLICPECGHVFEREDEKHDDKASDADILSKWKKPEEIEVDWVRYTRHQKPGKPDSLRVDYYIGRFDAYSKWICLNHQGLAREKALKWIKDVTDKKINNVDEALKECNTFRSPKKIIVNKNGKFPEIIGYIFEENKNSNSVEKSTNEKLMDLMG